MQCPCGHYGFEPSAPAPASTRRNLLDHFCSRDIRQTSASPVNDAVHCPRRDVIPREIDQSSCRSSRRQIAAEDNSPILFPCRAGSSSVGPAPSGKGAASCAGRRAHPTHRAGTGQFLQLLGGRAAVTGLSRRYNTTKKCRRFPNPSVVRRPDGFGPHSVMKRT